VQGHFFIATALSRALTKLALKYAALSGDAPLKQNRFLAEAMLIMASLLHYGHSGLAAKPISADDTDSINVCLRVLSERAPPLTRLFGDQSKQALNTLLDAKLHDEHHNHE
jgi:coatomer subunit beta